MKFTKLSNKVGDVVVRIIFALMILFVLGLAGGLVFIDFYLSTPIFSLMWIILLPSLGLIINWYLGKFFGDKYYNTGWVSEGNSVFDVEKTPNYYTRRMFVCFVECFLFALLMIRFIVLFHFSIASSVIGIIGSIIGTVIYFIVGMSSYEQSSIKNKKNFKKDKKIEETKADKTVVEKKQLHKFKFDKYPELLEKYNSFKLWNSRKNKTFENIEDKKQVLKKIDESLESLAFAVFNVFNEIKPDLLIKKTGEKIKWEEVINKPFEELSYMEKLILVRLLDRLYKYVLPNQYYNL